MRNVGDGPTLVVPLTFLAMSSPIRREWIFTGTGIGHDQFIGLGKGTAVLFEEGAGSAYSGAAGRDRRRGVFPCRGPPSG